MARRMVGRDRPSRSARSISFSSRVPVGSSPDSIRCSRCCATWKYRGTGLFRSSWMGRPEVSTCTSLAAVWPLHYDELDVLPEDTDVNMSGHTLDWSETRTYKYAMPKTAENEAVDAAVSLVRG